MSANPLLTAPILPIFVRLSLPDMGAMVGLAMAAYGIAAAMAVHWASWGRRPGSNAR